MNDTQAEVRRRFPLLRFVGDGTAGNVARLGLTSYADMLRFEWADRSFDRRYRVRTGHVIDDKDLDFADPEAQRLSRRYKASPPFSVARALAYVGARLGGLQHETLVDYGCGAGRVMIVAAEAGVGRVVGLDLSPSLTALARRNLVAYAARRHPRAALEVLEADAALFEPPAEARLFYFFRPFLPPVFDRTLARIRASVAAHPRDVWLLLYDSPMFEPRGLSLQTRVHGVDIWTNAGDRDRFVAD